MSDSEKKDPRLSRRLLVARLVGGASLAVAAVAAPETAEAQVRTVATDNDPYDAPGRGRYGTGLTDNDPNDAPGNGRGYRRRYGTGITDNDPSDGPGNGRGGGRRFYGGRTDADPYDAPGRGRY
jgi:hypothetical protein